MTTVATWPWWTYFVVGTDVISCGRIVAYDVERRSVQYLVDRGRPRTDNPYPLGTDEYEAWIYETRVCTYDHLWVDPDRSIALSIDDLAAMTRGERPPRFVELRDQDPQDFFGGTRDVISTYLDDEP